MKLLNLDPHFSPLGTSVDFEKFTFAGGEPHIKIKEDLSETKELMITHRVQSFSDLGEIFVATDALRRLGVQEISLLIPYFPGARQDRLMVNGEPLTVKVYADLINTLRFTKVIVLDPHSDVTPVLIDNVQVASNSRFVSEVLSEYTDYHLVAPDAGALKQIHNLALSLQAPSVVACGKTRNVSTGALDRFQVFVEDLGGKTCVVVDDICDGGGTFLGIARELKRKNAGKLILIVTHGIFSKGSDELAEFYDQIICTDAFSTINDERIQQIQLNANLLK